MDKNGNVFFGADGGLLRYTADSLIGIGKPPSINPTDTIKALAIDSSGLVWVGTTGGLAAYTGSGWVAYTTKNSSLTSNKISALAIDALDRKWIGTLLGGLCVLTGKPAVSIISKSTGKPSRASYGIKRTLQFNQFPVSGQLISNRFYDAAGRRIQTQQNQNKGKFHSASGIYFSEPASEAR
jgi:ligand-binding sensor domain-containing protein